MESREQPGTQLALLADDDRETARTTRPWLLSHGLELVHARAGGAALELLQRLPESFGLVLVSLDLPDISGAVLIETLRHFRPTLPVICLTVPELELNFDATACLSKPIKQREFNSQLIYALGSAVAPTILATFDPNAVARAKARFAVSGDLLEAAREIARGFAGERGEAN